jgi:hypothetical protein
MTRDEIMALVNETAPRYESWGCEAHFQAFAKRLMAIEREACADLCEGHYDTKQAARAIRERVSMCDATLKPYLMAQQAEPGLEV